MNDSPSIGISRSVLASAQRKNQTDTRGCVSRSRNIVPPICIVLGMASRESRPKTVFSFTTSPSRLGKCRVMIESITSQTMRPDLILLNIPEVFARTGERYNVPKWMEPLVTINVCDADYGPATKLAPTIGYLRSRGWSDETMIVYGDDDIKYPPDMFDTYMSLCDDSSAWCLSGLDLTPKASFRSWCPGHGGRVAVAEGFGSVCCRLGMFGDDFEEHVATCVENRELRAADDVVISNYFWMRDVPIRICSAPPPRMSKRRLWQEGRVLEYGKRADALHVIHATEPMTSRYKACIGVLDDAQFPIGRHFPLGDVTRQGGIPKVVHKVVIVDGGGMPRLSPPARDALASFSEMNPEYEVRVYTGKTCEEYIRKHYNDVVLDAFRSLVPYAFKADLFRYLVLYNEGGIYSDFRQVCLTPFREYIPDDADWFSTRDMPQLLPGHPENTCPMCIALLAASPRQPPLRRAIDMILGTFAAWQVSVGIPRPRPQVSAETAALASVARRSGMLGVTGPALLGLAFRSSPPTGKTYIGRLELDRSKPCGLELYDHNGRGGLIVCKHARADGSRYDGAEWGQQDGGGNDYGKLYRAGRVFEARAFSSQKPGSSEREAGTRHLRKIERIDPRSRWRNTCSSVRTASAGWSSVKTPRSILRAEKGYAHDAANSQGFSRWKLKTPI